MADLFADAAAGKITPIAEAAKQAATKPPEPEAPDAQQREKDLANSRGLVAASGEYEVDAERIYVDIDAILDLRLGTLATMGEDKAIKALNGDYFKRFVDEFDGVAKEEFEKQYAKKSKEALQRSVVTNVKFMLRRIVKDSLYHSIQNRTHEPIVFEVNIYPFEFSEKEIEMLIMCMRFVTYSTSAIRIISLSNADLTPDYIKSNYQVMIRYKWLDWMEEHKAYYEKKRTTEVTLMVPELFIQAPTEEDVSKNNMNKYNPFRETERAFAPLFRLKMMPVSLYCMTEQVKKDNAGKVVDLVGITEEDILQCIEEETGKKPVSQEEPLPEVPLEVLTGGEHVVGINDYDLL